jgi:hypothetical protein
MQKSQVYLALLKVSYASMKYSILILLLLLMSGLNLQKAGNHDETSGGRTYSTKFSFSENPLSDNGNWINGKGTGVDWSNVSVENGHAIGHQEGNVRYVDATALLTGIWADDQAARAKVFVGKTYREDYPEVELRLRSSLSPHTCNGYEIAFSAAGRTAGAYLILVRWNGPVGDFTYLADLRGPKYGVTNGDVIEATITGSTLTAYLNGVQIAQVTDTVYKSGSPGMGFNFDWVDKGKATGTNESYGFTEFTASDLVEGQRRK